MDSTPLNPELIRQDFPILQVVSDSGKRLVYLDNAASTQRPRQVLEAMRTVYETCYANVHRSGHDWSAKTTSLYEESREAVRRFIGARSTREVVFTPGTTGAINLVARSFGEAFVRAGDEILLTQMEHHSNIVPWQQLAARTGAVIRWIPVTDSYELDIAALDQLLSPKTRIVALASVSNVLGTINPVVDIIRKAHAVGAKVLIDAAQSIPHEPTDVQAWDADFVAFSGHKMLGPTGVGVLYGKEELLEAMPPFLGGGSMIRTVTQEGFVPADLPAKFEAGTPPIVSAIGLTPAIAYLEAAGLGRIHAHEQRLATLAHDLLSQIDGLRIIGPAPERKSGTVSFVVDGIQPFDIGATLNVKGVAIRAGHHCAMPLHARFNLTFSCRASFYIYNTPEDVERLVAALLLAKQWLAKR